MSLYCTEYILTNTTEMQNEHERLQAFSSCNSTYCSQNNYKQQPLKAPANRPEKEALEKLSPSLQ